MMKREKLKKTILQAILAIEKELELGSLPMSGPKSTKQLEQFLNVLIKMLCSVDNGAVVHDALLNEGMGEIIVDSWPLDSPLGEIILTAEQEYNRFFS